MDKKRVRGIIGITDEGQLIVTADYRCPYFVAPADWLSGIRECWYCKFADFRKSCSITLEQSICRCPQTRVKIVSGGENEQLSPLTENFISNIKGGIITCIFNQETQSSKAIYLNAGWTTITGYTLEELHREKNGNPQALVYPADKENADLEYSRQTQTGNEYALLYRIIRKGGSTVWVIDRGVVSIRSNGDIQNQSTVTEVTQIKEREEHLQRLAQLDLLTGLYNKMTFSQQVQLVLRQQHDKCHAMILLDLDDFKKINDTRGHACGDKVLEAVGGGIKRLFRNRDVLGRIGGDEFMILMTDVAGVEVVKQKAADLCKMIHDIEPEGQQGLVLTVSLGIALSAGGKDYDRMFRQADAALYQAKSNGKNQCAFCDEVDPA